MSRTSRILGGAAGVLVVVAGVSFAQTLTTSPTTPTTTGPTGPVAPTGTAVTTPTEVVEQLVAITQTVEPTTASVSAFIVPAGRRLVITDVIITNTVTSPTCAAAVSRSGAANGTGSPPPTNGTGGTGTSTTGGTTNTTGVTNPTTGTTGGAGTIGGTVNGTGPGGATVTPQAIASSTGVLCVLAQTSLVLPLATPLEFAQGESVVLANTPATGSAGGPLAYHLRGFLVVSV